jgi:hypothetical protein
MIWLRQSDLVEMQGLVREIVAKLHRAQRNEADELNQEAY